jgi:antitoxin MazE
MQAMQEPLASSTKRLDNVSTLFVGTAMRVEVQKWGNSAAVRLPSVALKDAGFAVGQRLELHVEGCKLVIEPAAERLEDLLDQMTPERQHSLHLEGPAFGNEAW